MDFVNQRMNHSMIKLNDARVAGLIRNNKTAAFIVECLKDDTTQEKIVEAMFEKYDAPKDVLAKDVSDVIEKLRKVGALDE